MTSPESSRSDLDLSIPAQVKDGFPRQVAIVTRERVAQGGANLAGLSEKVSNEPTVRLMNLALSTARDLTSREAVIGWCDPFGNIGIQEQ